MRQVRLSQRLYLLALTLFTLCATLLPAQNDGDERAPWILAEHDLQSEAASEDIARIIRSGYLPVGIEYQEGTLVTLYLDQPGVKIDQWAIQEFERLDNLNAELSQPMLEGWVPMDISKTSSGLTVMFVKTDDIEIEGWNIAIGPVETESIGQTFAAWRERGYTAYGTTLSENDEIWYLMLEIAGQESVPRVFFDGYPEGEVSDGITEQMEGGGIPWGLMTIGENTFIHYLF